MFWGFCSSWGAFCFAVLVVLPLVLCFFSSWCCGWQWSFDAGHCYWCLSAGLFFFLLVVVCWRLGGFCPPEMFVFFPRVVALAFVLWRLSFCALGLLLSLIQLPSAASAHGLCCVLRFRSSSSFFPLPFSFSSSSWLSSSLAVCVLCGLLPASLAWHCLVSGLPLCLVWSAPPGLF